MMTDLDRLTRSDDPDDMAALARELERRGDLDGLRAVGQRMADGGMLDAARRVAWVLCEAGEVARLIDQDGVVRPIDALISLRSAESVRSRSLCRPFLVEIAWDLQRSAAFACDCAERSGRAHEERHPAAERAWQTRRLLAYLLGQEDRA